MFKEKVRVQILEGKLTDKGKCLCGSYRGYEIMVNQMNGFYQICINAHSDDDVNNQKLAAFLAEHKTKVKDQSDSTSDECEDACIWFKVSGSDQ